MTAPTGRHAHRIVVYSHSADLVGAERALLRVVRHLTENGVEVLVVIPRTGPLEPMLRDAGASVVRWPLPKWVARTKAWPVFLARVLGAALTFPRLLFVTKRFRPCLAYTNSWVVPSGALAARVLHVPHIWHIREYAPGNESLRSQLPMPTIRRLTERWSTELVAMSESIASQFAGTAVPLHVVYVGVDPPTGVSTGTDDSARRWLADGQPGVLVLGTISAAKGTPTAVAMMDRLRREQRNARLLIVGRGTPAMMREITDQIATLRLRDVVRLEPFTDDPWDLMSSADVLLVPSRHEAYGLVTVEAQSAGVPVVGSATGGTRELLTMGGGLLATADDPDHFAAHVRAVADDPALYAWLSDQGRAVAATLDPTAEGAALLSAAQRLCRRDVG